MSVVLFPGTLHIPDKHPPSLTGAAAERMIARLLVGDARPTLWHVHEFEDERHQHIVSAIRDLGSKGAAVSPMSVARVLDARGVLDESGGPTYLIKILQSLPLSMGAA